MNSMFSSDQDRNAPDRYLDTAYKALKGNPNATNQVLQAAAQGQAVGLKGLAAAAAQQSQQQAQQAMAQQQAQTAGQQPTIIQKLAQQGHGIMGQLPGSIQLASAPTEAMAPQHMAGGGLVAFADGGAIGNDIDGSFGYEAADAYGDGSQGYAGGGLVSFADGGSVLPPDVIDAIQSHFAYGGEVRGFAEGDYLSPDEVRTKYDQMQKEIQDLLERKHLESKYRGLKGMSPEEMAREKARHAERVKMRRLSESSGFEPSAAEPEPKGPGYSDVYSEARAERAPKPASYRNLYGNAPRSVKEQYTTTAEPPAPKGPSYGDLYPKSAGPAGPNMYDRARYKDLYPSVEGAPEYTPYRPPEGPGPSMTERLAAHSAEPAPRLDPNMAKLARMAGQELPEITKAADAWTGGEGFSGAGKLGKFGGLGRLMSNPALGLLSPEVRGAHNLYTGAARKAVGMDGLHDIVSGANQLFDVGLPDVPTEQLSGALNWFRGADDEDMGDGYPKALGEKGKDAEVKQEGTYVPDPATVAPNQPEITPKSEVHKEGQKVSKEFETVKQPTPSVATTPGADTASLTSGESYGVPDSMGLGGLEQARDLVSQLRGQQRMDPEIAKRLEDMQSGARNSTIMQSIMGALGKGLTSRPGGRIALGEAALGALAGYQSGASSEDDMQRKAFDVYKQYADMPISEQQHAADFVLKAEKDKAAQQSAERIAEGKGEDALTRLLLSERGKGERSQLMAGQKGGLTEGQKLSAITQAREDAQKSIAKDFIGREPPPGELERRIQHYYISALQTMGAGEAALSGVGMGGGTQLGAGGLGGGSGGLTVTRSGVIR